MFKSLSSMTHVQELVFSDVLNRERTVDDVLVLFDIDNTLLEPSIDTASDQWFDASLRFYQAQGLTVQQALERILPLWMRLLGKVTMQPVEPQVVELVRQLGQARVPAMAFTVRPIQLCALTIQQLRSAGMDFGLASPATDDLEVKYGSWRMRFEQGVLFCDGNDKGQVLARFLDLVGLHPRTIVFVDDKERHVRSVATIVEQRGINFVGLRYGFLDEKVKNFKLDSASIKLLQNYHEQPGIPVGRVARPAPARL